MEKRKIALIISAILVVVLVAVGGFYTAFNNDAARFKKEYESINGTIREKDGKTIRSITIPSKNPMVYKSASKIVEAIKNKETFVVYFGFQDCPWCRSVLPTLIDVANDLKMNKIYYVDVKDIRDVLDVDDEGNVVVTKEGTDAYYELIEMLDSVLTDYVLTDKDGNKVDTGEGRIMAPNVVAVVNGKVVGLVTGISDAQNDGYMEITDEMREETYNRFKTILQCEINKDETCKID
ncbi:MAG: hypothetical protein K2J20_00070 [Bacilli bacterium]|nr:hypothetical protein [Bacilli bacterium]